MFNDYCVCVSVPLQTVPVDALRAHPSACRSSCQQRFGFRINQMLKMAHDLNWLSKSALGSSLYPYSCICDKAVHSECSRPLWARVSHCVLWMS